MNRTFVIAEIGVNHNGSVNLARELILKASELGVDAVKFQTFRSSELASEYAPKASYQIASTGLGHSQREMLASLELPLEAYMGLKALADELGIEFMSTAFDVQSLDFLVTEVGLKRIKIPSGEITNGPLLFAASRKGLPLIISTGMCDLTDIRSALNLLAHARDSHIETGLSMQPSDRACASVDDVTLLHCTTAYPTQLIDCNLKALHTLSTEFGLPVGYSDHTLGTIAAPAAVACGASVIEKHITSDRRLPGPDHSASLEPEEFRSMVQAIRDVEAALGSSEKVPTDVELLNSLVARRSLIAVMPIKRGEEFTPTSIGSSRPGTGVSPMLYWDYLGQSASRDYAAGEMLD